MVSGNGPSSILTQIMHDKSALTLVATLAAQAAGKLLRSGFGTSYEISSKPGRQNLVTEYDKKAEALIIEMIRSQFPSHNFLAEESGASKTQKGEVLWVIDPLDGTVNFAHNIPLFAVSIAATAGKEILSGVIYQPMTDELFIAEKGKGAYLNGQKLQVSATTNIEMAILATGFPYNVDENPLGCIDTFTSLVRLGIPIRRFGAAAIDLAYVAAGRFDAYWEVLLHPWDMAAGKLLIEEAGGRVTHYDGSDHKIFDHSTLLASNGILHPTMLKALLCQS